MLNAIYYYLPASAALYSSDNSLNALWISIGAAIVIAASLIAQSRTKVKATKAEKYISSKLKLTESSDVYTHTTTSKRSINK